MIVCAIHEHAAETVDDLKAFFYYLLSDNKAAPIFIKDSSGEIHILPKDLASMENFPGPYQMVYMGRQPEADLEEQENVVENVSESKDLLH